jgi:hypothetical protein
MEIHQRCRTKGDLDVEKHGDFHISHTSAGIDGDPPCVMARTAEYVRIGVFVYVIRIHNVSI